MTPTYTLTTIEHALEVALQLRRYWFRGHGRACNELSPKVHRLFKTMPEPFTQPNVHALESYLFVEFQRMAPAYAVETPSIHEPSVWWCLMQHHGSPTRLLDWTESAWVALYFAIAADKDVDGELWALHGASLNRLSGINGFPVYYNNPIYRWLMMEPLVGHPDVYQEKIELPEIPTRPIAVRPALGIPRLLHQAGAFTLHPFPQQGMTLPELLGDERELVRYVIPAAAKEQLRCDLHALGVHRRALFPDLDGLSLGLLEEERTWPTTRPRPPQLGGPWPPP